jgi:murein L,D-transpeptidase YcbB/YkuD
LNPTWTSPDSIFAEYELPEIKKDPQFISLKNFVFLRKPRETEKVDPSEIDFAADPMTIVKQYRLRQEPGPGNSLGLFRFGLNNEVDVYLHDTDNRALFRQGNRFQSSGCIRLEKPNELAQYLMQSSPEYSIQETETFETSRLCKETNYPSFFPRPCKDPQPSPTPNLLLPGEQSSQESVQEAEPKQIAPVYETKHIRFPNNRPLPPVYTVYITVGRVGDRVNGRIRYSLDPYGQDSRVEQLINQNVYQEGF